MSLAWRQNASRCRAINWWANSPVVPAGMGWLRPSSSASGPCARQTSRQISAALMKTNSAPLMMDTCR